MEYGSHGHRKGEVEEQSHVRMNMSDGKWTIGIESTAHTFSFGLVDPNGIPPSVGDTIKPLEGGIHPREAADHHRDYAAELFQRRRFQQLLPLTLERLRTHRAGLDTTIGASVARTLSSKLMFLSWR